MSEQCYKSHERERQRERELHYINATKNFFAYVKHLGVKKSDTEQKRDSLRERERERECV